MSSFFALAQPAQALELSVARQQYYAGHYDLCLSSCKGLIELGSPDREQAFVLLGRTLLRRGLAAEAAATLVAEVPSFESAVARLEAEAVLARAHATLNDFATADAIIDQLNAPEAQAAPASVRAELLYVQALVAWMKGDLTGAEAALNRTEDTSPLIRGQRVMMQSWIASKRERYDEHARLMLEGVEVMQTGELIDVGLLATAARAVCSMAREVYVPNLVRRAKELYDRVDWAADVPVEHFNAARTLGWAMALQGTDQYFESVRLLHRASTLAPTEAWKVWSLLDRSAMKRYAGETGAAGADLYEALELARSTNWGETTDEERTGLLYAAELLAPLDSGGASALLLQFNQLRESFSSAVSLRGDRRLEAGTAYSTGVIQQALNDTKKARHFFESAYHVYDEIGYKWRAARTALRLYQVTQDEAWHQAAQRQIRDYPNSWIASDIREASTGIGDDGWNRLTPRQREVFNSLCEGLTAKRIGERLKCSPNTVRNHIHWVYQAFRVQSQPELITEARKRKLIS